MAVAARISLPVDLYEHLEATDSCASTPKSVERLREPSHTAQSWGEMHQVRSPWTASAAQFSAALFSAPSPPAWPKVLKQLTQTGMQRKENEHEGMLHKHEWTTVSGARNDGPRRRSVGSPVSRDIVSTSKHRLQPERWLTLRAMVTMDRDGVLGKEEKNVFAFSGPFPTVLHSPSLTSTCCRLHHSQIRA